MRVVALLGLAGIWRAAAALGGPPAVTAALAGGAAALAAWAVAVFREP